MIAYSIWSPEIQLKVVKPWNFYPKIYRSRQNVDALTAGLHEFTNPGRGRRFPPPPKAGLCSKQPPMQWVPEWV